jgi:hypothetical protein
LGADPVRNVLLLACASVSNIRIFEPSSRRGGTSLLGCCSPAEIVDTVANFDFFAEAYF